MTEVTRILTAIDQGDPHAAEQLLPLVYGEFRKLAAQKLAQEKPGQTLQATALVHEAYLRLVGESEEQHWNTSGHFVPPRPRPCDGFSSSKLDTRGAPKPADNSSAWNCATSNWRLRAGTSILLRWTKRIRLSSVHSWVNLFRGGFGSAPRSGFEKTPRWSGSCTLAQAVLEVNRQDDGNRNFLMVQLPEPTDSKDCPTIAEMGKERIRRAITKLNKDNDGKLDMKERDKPEDLGFKVFKLAPPHVRPWSHDGCRDADDYAAKLALFNDPLAPGWTPQGVLWEVALREGYSLNTRFQEKALSNGNTVWKVTDSDSGQSFAVCLDDTVRSDLSRVYELTPDRLLACRDKALDDTAAANLALQCRLKTI